MFLDSFPIIFNKWEFTKNRETEQHEAHLQKETFFEKMNRLFKKKRIQIFIQIKQNDCKNLF